MEPLELDDLRTCLKVLSNPARYDLFRVLSSAGDEGLRLSTLARAVGVPSHVLPTHLRHLANARLVKFYRNGGGVLYVINRETASKLKVDADHELARAGNQTKC